MGRPEMSAHILGLELTLLLAFWLSLAVWQKDPETPGRLNFVLLAVAVGLWCFGELVGLRGAVTERVADRIKYAGALPLPSLWLGLAARDEMPVSSIRGLGPQPALNHTPRTNTRGPSTARTTSATVISCAGRSSR